MVYIPEGAVLTFTKNPDKKVTTVGENDCTLYLERVKSVLVY